MTLMSYYANKGAWLMTSLYNVHIIKITMYDHISSPLVMGFNLIYILPYKLPFQILPVCHICKKGGVACDVTVSFSPRVRRCHPVVFDCAYPSLVESTGKKLKTTKHGLVKLLPDYRALPCIPYDVSVLSSL
jgi:hypothetical protein